MTAETHDLRDIPVLTDAVEADGRSFGFFDPKAVHAAVVSETLKLADSLLHRAVQDIEATLFERVFDELRSQLPELVDRALREHSMTNAPTAVNAIANDGEAGALGLEPGGGDFG